MSLDDADPRICWLGAFAMGLAVSSQSDAERVGELVEASAGDETQLRAACERVRELGIGDPAVRRTAVGLLEAAIDAVDRIDLTATDVPAGVDAV